MPNACEVVEAAASDLRGPLVGVDPVDELADAGVDTGVVGLSAAVAPGDETVQDLGGVDDGAARVTRARVPATGGETGAEHVGGDGRGSILGLAGGARDDGDGDLPQGGGQGSAVLGQQTPIFGESALCSRRLLSHGTSWKTYQPATVREVPEAGSEPWAGRVA